MPAILPRPIRWLAFPHQILVRKFFLQDTSLAIPFYIAVFSRACECHCSAVVEADLALPVARITDAAGFTISIHEGNGSQTPN